jgi:hypothetical protein
VPEAWETPLAWEHILYTAQVGYNDFHATVEDITHFTKWPSLSTLVPFKGSKKSRAPWKVLLLCRDHLESLKWPHLVIFKGWFHNVPPNLQHRDINSYNNLVLPGRWSWQNLILRPIYKKSFPFFSAVLYVFAFKVCKNCSYDPIFFSSSKMQCGYKKTQNLVLMHTVAEKSFEKSYQQTRDRKTEFLTCITVCKSFRLITFFVGCFFYTFFNGFKTPHQMLRFKIPISTIFFKFISFLLALFAQFKAKIGKSDSKKRKKNILQMCPGIPFYIYLRSMGGSIL